MSFIPNVFLKILQRHAKDMQACYFWYLGYAWLCTSKLIVSIRRKTSMLICMPKNKLHYSLLYRDYILKNTAIGLANSTLTHNSRKHFTRCRIGDEASTTMVVFISDYFQENLKAKLFKKSKKRYFGGHFGHFFPQIRTKMNFPGKKGSVSFEILQLFTIVQKSQKKLMSHSWEKCRNDSRTDWRWTDRQQWFYRTLRRTGVQ